MKKSFLLLLVLLAVAVTAAAQEPKREFRSVWLTTYQLIDWPSSSARGNEEKCKAELLEYLDNHEKRNYTGVCLHVRTWADAVYKSSYEPWSEWVSGTRGKDPGWDPLAFAVEECHKRGLECYAWVNPFRFSRNWQARTTPQDLEVLSKGWIIDNGTTTQHNEYQIFNPALPEVREYLYGIMKEIYTNYRIDGFLFDDYFYPNKIPADNTAQDYADFQEQNPGVSGTKENINNWRRGNINLFMRELYAMVQKDRPDIRFGLSPPAWQRKVAPISRVSTCALRHRLAVRRHLLRPCGMARRRLLRLHIAANILVRPLRQPLLHHSCSIYRTVRMVEQYGSPLRSPLLLQHGSLPHG